MIRRRTYQAASEDSMWAYERVSNLWTDIEPGSYSSDDGSSDEGNKDQEKPDGQEQEEVALVSHGNPINIRRCDQRALNQLKSEI